MLAYAELLRSEAADAERLAAEGLARGTAAMPPVLRFALHAVHGAAAFDRGDRAAGLAELQQARSEFGDNQAGAEQCGSDGDAGVPRRTAARALAAARTVLGWLAERTGDNGELLVMRAWAETRGVGTTTRAP